MRKIWIRVEPWDKEMVTTALECGAFGVMVPEGHAAEVRQLGKIVIMAPDGDLVPGTDVTEIRIESREDEEAILGAAQTGTVILDTSDWKIIPLENLIARGASVIFKVETSAEAKTAFQILEQGVDQIVFEPKTLVELKNFFSDLSLEGETTLLETAEIVSVTQAGMGDRVCIDTCTMMTPGQGILAGNSSKALFLVHSESLENPYVAARPFRVNAGPVHAYTRVPGGRTRYLSELEAGDPILITGADGRSFEAVTGRLKIEKRPLMLVKARAKEKEISLLVQNAETIRLTTPKGEALSVVDLKPGDTVLVALETNARHFGHSIEESILEQ
ncbi:MAG: 3-dehydroquinate synthase II [Desulfobacteraceae bacterium]|nr:3-dehydroquinate synthase II [Desulfobacteraceae bacterium]